MRSKSGLRCCYHDSHWDQHIQPSLGSCPRSCKFSSNWKLQNHGPMEAWPQGKRAAVFPSSLIHYTKWSGWPLCLCGECYLCKSGAQNEGGCPVPVFCSWRSTGSPSENTWSPTACPRPRPSAASWPSFSASGLQKEKRSCRFWRQRRKKCCKPTLLFRVVCQENGFTVLLSFYFFKKKLIYFMCLNTAACMYGHHVCQLSLEVRRGIWN